MRRGPLRKLLAPAVAALFLITLLAGSIQIALAGPVAGGSFAGAPAEVLIGESFSFTVNLQNTGDAPGYGPYVDLVFPRNGADGAGAAVDDGVSFISATYAGQTVQTTLLTFNASGNATHPYARTNTGAAVVVTGAVGDQLVVLRLPFGSYVPAQPPLPIVVTASTSNLADANVPLTIKTNSGFMFGTDALDNPTTDPSLIGATATTNVSPTLFRLSTTYAGPEDETATGPNWPRQYTVAVDVANGQTVTNVDLTDVLPGNAQFISVDATSGATTSPSTPSTTTPGGTLTRRFASIAGTAATTDASITFSLSIPRTNAVSSPVLDASSGAPASAVEDTKASGSWTPVDVRDLAGSVSSDATAADHTLGVKSLAIQKSVLDLTHPSSPQPHDSLRYTLSTQFSDFFAFDSVLVTDVISDGQLVDGSFVPTISYLRDGVTESGPFDPANYAVVVNGDGTSTVTFDVSAELLARGFAGGRVVGGCIPNAGVATPNCATTNLGKTQATIVFRSTIQDTFANPPVGKNASVDEGDVLSDAVTASGMVLDTNTLAQTGSTATDSSSLTLTIGGGVMSKTVYAVNGVACPCGSPVTLTAEDTITYAIAYATPSSSIESFTVTDYLPLPVFLASEVTTFSATTSATPPPVGTARYGPADTFHSLPAAPTPSMTTSASGNSVAWAYAGYNNHPTDPASTIQLLFTVTASNQPMADGLYLTNQAQFTSQTTNGTDATADTTNQIQLQEPNLVGVVKGVVATNGATPVFAPVTAGPVTFNAPGTAGARWAGTITSTNVASTPINSNVSGLQKGDLVTFALVVENSGSGPNGAFDVKVKDDLPTGFVVPAGGLNVRVADGTNTAIAFTDLGGGLLGTGIQLNDGATGAIKASSPTSGQNIAVVTYDLQVATTVGANQTITNTATLFGYASAEAGPTFTADKTDTATAATAAFVATKSVVTTSEAFTTGTGVAIGEVVRYRLQLQVPETGTLTNVQLADVLPPGLTFLNDGTARVMFVSNLGGMTSTGANALAGAGLAQSGNAATLAALTPTFVLPDVNVASSTSLNADTYVSGTDVFFKLADLTNNDGDADAEFVVVEFNAIVDNSTNGASPRNVLGGTLDNAFSGRVNGTTNGVASPNARVTVQTPQVTLAKTTTTALINASDTVSYRLVLSNSNNANATTGYELTLSDPLPVGLTLNLGSIATSTSGTVGAVVDTSAGNTVSFTVASLAKNSSLTVDFTAASASTLTPGQVLTNTAVHTATSLLGTFGTTGNATGSDTPSAAGSSTGERTGTGTNPNTLNGSGAVNVTVYSSTLSGTAYTDLNNNGVYNAGVDAAIVGKTVTLTGTDHLGGPVSLSTTTNASGAYSFANLRGGTYTITKAAAVKAWEGTATVGSQASGTAAAPAITSISIATGAIVTGTGNNIGEILRADLSVVKTVARPLYLLGENISYTLTVANAGPSDATLTVVTDTLPASTTFVSATPSQGSCSGSVTVTCNLGTVVTGTTPTIALVVTPTTTGTFSNTASISSSVIDQTPGNNSSSVDTNVESMNPTKSLVSTSESSTSGADLAIGEVVRYRLVVTLPELPTFADLQLHEQLPAGLTYLDDGTAKVALVSNVIPITSSTIGVGGTFGDQASLASVVPSFVLPDANVSSTTTDDNDTYVDGTDVYFKLGDVTNLDGDGSGSQEFAVIELNAIAGNVAGSTGTTPISNVFQPRVGGAAVGPASNTVADTIRVPSVTTAKAVSSATADAGNTRTFTVTLTNSTPVGGPTAFDLHLGDTLPAGYTLNVAGVVATPGGGAAGLTDASSGNTVDLTVDTLPPAATVVVTYSATLSLSVTPGQILTNTASTTWTTLPASGTAVNGTGSTAGVAGSTTGERTGAGGVNNLSASDSKTVTINSSTLSGTIYLDIDHSGTRNAGDTAIVGKTVTLTGTDHLGAAVNLATTTSGAGAYSFASLRPGTYAVTKAAAVQRIEGAATIGSQASGTAAPPAITGIVLPTGASTIGTGNDIGEELETDLALAKTVNLPVVLLGDNAVFTLTVTNDGPSPATGVTVTDTLPAGLTFVSATPTQGSCSGSATVTCVLGTLAPAGTATVTIAAGGIAGSYTNTATVTGAELDPAPGDNTASASFSIQSLSPVKSVTATSVATTGTGTVAIGEIARYRLQVTLPETPTIAGLQLHDVLPAGMRFIDDGTAKVAFVSDGVGITSSTLGGAGLSLAGNQATVDAITPTFVLPDAAVSRNPALDDDTYASGDDVYFGLGDVTNTDGDPSTANRELAVVEFNAVILNIAGNQAGTTLANTLEVRLRGVAWAGPLSNTVTETVTVPSISITKSAASPTADAADDVDFHLVVTNAAGANVATALDTHVADAMPTGFTLDTGSVAVVVAGGASGVTDASTSSALDLTIAQMPAGSTVTIDYTAGLSTTVAPASTLTNTALLTSSTIPGDGSGANATGSSHGAAGGATGERNGSGGVNDLADNASAVVTINSSTLAGTVYLDADSSGTYNGGDSPVAGKTVTLTGTDHLGNAVSTVTTTDAGGAYVFALLRPGTYTIDKAIAVLRADGVPAVGAQGSGTAAPRSISAISLPTGASTVGTGNNFPELIRSDLQVTKTGSPATVVAGDDVTYTITVTNQGPSPATGVTLNDPVPAALQVTGTTTDRGTCSTVANTVACAFGPMSVGAIANVTVTVTSTVEGTFTNTAMTAADQIDPNPADNSGSDSTYVQLFAPTKTIVSTSEASTAASAVTIGEVVRYRLQITLSGSPVMTNLQLWDLLPPGLTFLNDGTAKVALVGDGGVSSSTLVGPGVVQAGNETNIGSISPTATLPDVAVSSSSIANVDSYSSGADVYFKLGDLTDADADADEEFAVVEFNAIVANIAAAAPGATLDNTFEVHLGSNPNISVSPPVGVSVLAPSLSVGKTSLDAIEDGGEPVRFEVVVTAAAGATRSDAFETAIVDNLPAGLTLNLASVAIATSGTVVAANDASSGNTMRVDVGRMAPGATVTVSYTATVSGTPAQVLTNTAIAAGTTLPGDGTTGNPTGSDAGTPGTATGERDGSGGVNDLTAQASATVTVHSSSLAGHVFTDLDSDGAQDVGEPPVVGRIVTLTGIDHLGGAVSLTATTDAGGDYVFTLLRPGTYTVRKGVAPDAADGAAIAGTLGGVAATATVSAIVLPEDVDTVATGYDLAELIRADLALTKSGPGSAILGTNVTFTLTATNNGPSPATNVTVNDPLPSGLAYVSATAAQGSCSAAGSTVVCSLGGLARGASTSVTVSATAVTVGTVTNSATVSGTEIDPVPANNNASDSVSVRPKPIVADLAVTKTASAPRVKVGEPVTFTWTVTNNGPDPVDGVRLLDALSDGGVAKPARSGRGTCTFSQALQVTCLLGTLAPGDTVVITQVVTPTAPGRIGGPASVSGAVELETNTTNNDASAWVDVVAAGPGGIKCTISAKPGQHQLTGTPGDDVICGTPGNDVITGRGGADVIYGLGGNDRLIGGAGNDLLCGGTGRDALKGGAGNDGLSGGIGNDRLFGGPGNDGLYGNAGNDELVGDLGHDRLVGGVGTDTVLARDRVSDLVDGGGGRDRAVLDVNRDFFRSIERRDLRR